MAFGNNNEGRRSAERARNLRKFGRFCVYLAAVLSVTAVGQTSSSITLNSIPNPATLGQVVTLAATVTPGATGKVTFYSDTSILGIRAVSGGQATMTTVDLPAGAGSLRAIYGGDGSFAPSTSATVAQTVKALPSLGFKPAQTYAVGQSPADTAVGDFNGDGKTDIALANGYDTSVSVLLSSGVGFQPAIAIPIDSPNSLATGDFNGDGNLDLAVLSGTSIRLLLGNGGGTFQAGVTFSTGVLSQTIRTGDFNADGKADLVFGGAANQVMVVLGNGNGSFQPSETFPITGTAHSIVVGDFNGDAKADLAVAASDTILVSVLLGKGDGTFFDQSNYGIGPLKRLVAGDLNGDGFTDLVAGDVSMLGKADGILEVLLSPAFGVDALAAGDFDGDGRLDIIAQGRSQTTQSRFLYGLGDGRFQLGSPTAITVGDTPSAVADFNGDGRTDIAIPLNLPGTGPFAQETGVVDLRLGGALPDLAVTMNHDNGFTQGQVGAYHITITNFGDLATSGTVTVTSVLPSGMTASAISGNGWACELTTLTCTRSDQLSPFGNRAPVIDIRVNVAGNAVGPLTTTSTVSAANDGNLANNTVVDTAVSRLSTSINLISLPGLSTLTQPVTLTATVSAGTGKVTFYDGAAVLGIATILNGQAAFTTSSLSPGAHLLTARYQGDTDYGPSLSAPRPHAVTAPSSNGFQIRRTYEGAQPNTLEVADFNRDGKLDLVTANPDGGISILFGNGDGSLRWPVVYTIDANTTSSNARTGDFNGDGFVDVLVDSISFTNVFAFYLFLGNGDGTFLAPTGFTTDLRNSKFCVADFDGDGRLDLCGGFSNGVSIAYGNGDGTFQERRGVPLGGLILGDVLVANLNGDDKPDLIVMNDSTALVFLGIGGRAFQPGASISLSASSTQAISIADFNGDGNSDLVRIYANSLDVLLGNGDGTFQGAVTRPLNGPAYVRSLIVGDMNGDGRQDLAYRPLDRNTVAIALGIGNGAFQPVITLPSSASNGILDVALDDLNGDGLIDLVAGRDVYLGGQFLGLSLTKTHSGPLIIGKTKTYQITIGNPAFTASNGTVLVTDIPPFGLTATAIAGTGWTCSLGTVSCTRSDVLATGSTYPSIAVTVSASGALAPGQITNSASVMHAGITNSVQDPTQILSPTSTSLTASPNPAAFGQPVTLIATVSGGGAGYVNFSNGLTHLGGAQIIGNQARLVTRQMPASLQSIRATYSGDATSGASTSPPVVLSVQAGQSNGLTQTASLVTGVLPWSMKITDFNGDGKQDIVTLNKTSATLSIFLGKGDGTFQAKADYAVGGVPTALEVADFNGDQRPDIAVLKPQPYGGVINLYLANNDGTLAVPIVHTLDRAASAIAVSDFNNDGMADLFVAGGILLLGKGDGSFTQIPGILADGPVALQAGDWNGDGAADVVGGFFYQGNGDGTFFASSDVGLGMYQYAVGDLNGDGNLDLIGTRYPETITLRLGLGDGSFQDAISYGMGGAPFGVAVTDVNGDGKLDLITANSSSNNISIRFGNGDGTFQGVNHFAAGSAPRSVLAGDFNNDGRTDLAVVNQNSNSITVLLGVLSPVLSVSKTHTGAFSPGQTGGTYTISVMNNGPGATSGAITVIDTLPVGLTATAISGTGWNCTLATYACTRSESLTAGASYSPITLTVSVAANAPSLVTNGAFASGGGAVDGFASDPTVIMAVPAAPVLVSPINASSDASTTPILSWNAASGAASYDVFFGTSSVSPPFAGNTLTTQFNTGQLAPGRTYFWRVVARNAAGSASSAIWSFTTAGSPGTSNPGIFRSGFYWLQDADGDKQFTTPADRAFAFGGVTDDVPITGDWNGDGKSKVGVYRPANGLFILDYDGDGAFTATDKAYNLGVGVEAGDKAVVGDWNGDGRTKVGLFRQGFFWILDYNGNGVFEQAIDNTYAFGGVAGDTPVVGDWNGDGVSKIGLFRLGFYWILDANGNGSLENINMAGGDQAFAYGGIAGDVPVVGDWNGDGVSKVGVFRQGFFWVLDANGNRNFDGTAVGQDLAFPFGGINGDKPIVGKW